jgi:hypothetical protein
MEQVDGVVEVIAAIRVGKREAVIERDHAGTQRRDS